MKILCLFVRHGPTKYPEALAVLDRWYVSVGLKDQRTLWIIDNRLDAGSRPEVVAPGAVLRPGDNAAWEFSAWARALREARAEGTDYDVVHFVTSAFNTLYTGYLGHFHREMPAYVVARNACLGHIDSHPAPLRMREADSNAWVRSCFFFLPRSVAQTLSPWAAFNDPEEFFASPDSCEFRPYAPLSADYQSHITAWLDGREIGGHQWHSPVRHGPGENTRFQQKTLAILNEHWLAITLRQAGVRLVDFCWLFSLRDTPTSKQPDPPAETEQLVIRRRILGIPEPRG